jgi:hypothetical protein
MLLALAFNIYPGPLPGAPWQGMGAVPFFATARSLFRIQAQIQAAALSLRSVGVAATSAVRKIDFVKNFGSIRRQAPLNRGTITQRKCKDANEALSSAD